MTVDNGCKVIRAEEVAPFSFGGALCALSVSKAKSFGVRTVVGCRSCT